MFCRLTNRSNSSILKTTTTGRPCFSTVTGSARAVSSNNPNAFFASFADMDFIVLVQRESVAIMAILDLICNRDAV